MSAKNKKRNKSHAKKKAINWDGVSETTKDTIRAAKRNYGEGLAK
jgi:hypothetical protein